MLFMDFVAEHEMVVVEQPWLTVVATFPQALQRRIYGT
jgi:U3 small nucleolar RNA-associated protein 4